ncbi:uncharacterized protein LOC9655265 isoform X1 [Selaginella moellendorffii]|nr:uncharacterized protein LOC9655265 isoform X1 [Selaginella moellendorffii]XP_024522524.1 uncharacterized protein LOC9655265 isoform X1 [Selaginella moellendorffii]|eukprot:XP_024522520.1 uncharacterized protein LOC9655265 isoform X1 [Selaginella moellendorffii]
MARAITSTSKWVTCSIRSKPAAIDVPGRKNPTPGMASRRSRTRFFHAMPPISLYGSKLSKSAGRIAEKPAVLPSTAAAAWSEEELRIVEQDLEGDDLPGRWSQEVLDEDVKVLTKFRSRHNLVQVLEISRRADSTLAGSRVLLLDRPGNIHSVHFFFKVLTGSYYDSFAMLPPLIPPGPIAILGLGAGTAARIIHHFWPRLEIHGWEMDASVVGVGRRYFGMLDLENGKPSDLAGMDEDEEDNDSGYCSGEELGKLVVHIGDALARDAVVQGGFAGIIVDLFWQGRVIAPLQRARTWRELGERLKPGGRIMVNCGGSCVEAEDRRDGDATMRETVAALMEAFPGGGVSTRTFFPHDNCVAMTGAFPDLAAWRRELPKCLWPSVSEWRPTS